MKDINQIKDNLHFQDLMLYRIHEILLIASPYDAFTLEQDGKLTEQILNEYIGMNLSSPPRVWNATSAKMAITMLSKRNFDNLDLTNAVFYKTNLSYSSFKNTILETGLRSSIVSPISPFNVLPSHRIY